MHLGLVNVKGNDRWWRWCGPNDCINTYHHVFVVVFFYDDDDDDDDDDDNDNDDDDDDNGNGGGSVGCSGGDNYFTTEDYLYNNYIKKMLHKLGLRRPIY